MPTGVSPAPNILSLCFRAAFFPRWPIHRNGNSFISVDPFAGEVVAVFGFNERRCFGPLDQWWFIRGDGRKNVRSNLGWAKSKGNSPHLCCAAGRTREDHPYGICEKALFAGIKPVQRCRDFEWPFIRATSLKRDMLGRSSRQAGVAAMVYPIVSSRVGGSLRIARSVANWLACSTWAWLTLRLGSPARRMARRSSVVVARYFIARPRLMRRGETATAAFPCDRGAS